MNRQGHFNVPMGSYANPTICGEANLRRASEALAIAEVRCRDFGQVAPERGDLVYCDPPYDETYAGYTGGGFGAGDQERLRDACLTWIERGAHVIASNNDTPLIRSLYKRFTLHEVRGRRSVNRDGDGRGSVPELIITP